MKLNGVVVHKQGPYIVYVDQDTHLGAVVQVGMVRVQRFKDRTGKVVESGQKFDSIWQEMVSTTAGKTGQQTLSETAFKALFKTAVAKARRVVADAVARSAMVEAVVDEARQGGQALVLDDPVAPTSAPPPKQQKVFPKAPDPQGSGSDDGTSEVEHP